MTDVVVVESPAKAKTINRYLGDGYTVLASFGHVRDLPPKDGSVRPTQDFAMDWEADSRGDRQVGAIAKALRGAKTLYLATDPDREGEAISWHVRAMLEDKNALKGVEVRRITFNEITRNAIRHAIAHPRELDQPLIEAYLARRALDYLVGFTLSPVLWRKLPGSRSAGRVQSVALRLICEREAEIEIFRPREYWTVEAEFLTPSGAPFTARLTHLDGKRLDQFDLNNEQLALRAKAAVESGQFSVGSVERRRVKRNPPPPFTTSTLQQEASRKLGFGAQQTMRLAQQLYEGVDLGGETTGLITYMRTDGVQMAREAVFGIRDHVKSAYGPDYLPGAPREYQSRAKNAQEAHEAIRPTDVRRTPDSVAGDLNGDQRRLYELIWKRAVASQMQSAELDQVSVDVTDANGVKLRATGSIVAFDGFLKLYREDRDDDASGAADDDENRMLPPMAERDPLKRNKVDAIQHFTQPPPRYSEASLVKKLEELGIGRPSTYASIIQVLKDRAYVRTEKNRFFAEESGRLLTAFLERFFEKYVSYDFTAELEEELDDVSGGRAAWQAVLEAFWKDFKPRTSEVMEFKPSEVTAELDKFLEPYLFPPKADGSDPRLCPSCGAGRLALRGGRFGAFVACSNYPECKYTRRFAQPGGGEAGEDTGPEVLGTDPETGLEVSRRSGRFGPYLQLGEGKEAKRSSIPKDLPGDLDLEWALKLLSLPRIIGAHPETGEEIEAAIGRYGPYLKHAGKYARLGSTAEVFETGMNAAVVKLAEAAASGGRPARGAAREPLKLLGKHPRTEAELKLMEGRYGAYVTDGAVNATLPKSVDKDKLTLEEAAQLIDEKAAKAPAKGKKKVAAKKPVAKKPSAKKPAPKKAAAKE